MTSPADAIRTDPEIHFIVVLDGDAHPTLLIEELTRYVGPWRLSLISNRRQTGRGPGLADRLPGMHRLDPRIEVLRGASTGKTLAGVLKRTRSERVVLLDPADRIGVVGLQPWVAAATRHRSADIVVGDESQFIDGRWERLFLPVPDRFSVLSRPVASGPYLVRADAARRVGWLDSPEPQLLWADLIRRLAADGSAERCAEVLLSRQGTRPRPSRTVTSKWIAGLEKHTGISPVSDGTADTIHLSGPGQSRGTVSVIIPTVGAGGMALGQSRTYILTLLEHLLAEPSEEIAELIVVVDAHTPRTVRDRLEKLATTCAATHSTTPAAVVPIRLIDDLAERFDFSRKVNLGAAIARGSVLLLLNDDMEPISQGWLGAMCDLLRIDGVAVVGATLLYEDDTVQHAGIVAVEGLAGHFGQGRPYSSSFADNMWLADRSTLGVTGACLMTTSSTWEAVGGFSPAFPVNFNDVDYCMKARQLAGDIVISAGALLRHFESRSRVAVMDDTEYHAMAARWYDQMIHDPYHPGGAAVVAAPERQEPRWPSAV